MNVLGLIGARGGSKGLPGKNIRDFAGKPLLTWTVESALESSRITDVVVSTDSPEICRVAQASGARAPFLRPAELAADHSNVNDAVIHALEWLREHEGRHYDSVVLLQPTQPLRPTTLIDEILDEYYAGSDSQLDTMVTVYRAPGKSAYLMRPDNGFVSFVLGSAAPNRQEVATQLYYPAGVLYAAPVRRFMESKTFYGERTRFFEVDEITATDIDTEEDFELALRHFEETRR